MSLGSILCASRRRAGVAGGGQALIPQGTGTAIGTMTLRGGLAKAFDGNSNQDNINSAAGPNASLAYIGKDWGAGVTKTITGFKCWGANNKGFNEVASGNSITLTLIGHTANAPASGISLGSITFADSDDGTLREMLTGLTTTTAYRYHWISVSADSVGEELMAELEFYEG